MPDENNFPPASASAAGGGGGGRAMQRQMATAVAQQQQAEPVRCPRCDSSNTKFCYYNNYSLSQPRHFCKSCKRYWTRGGTLRNVPVGGGCRKNKRGVKRPAPATATGTTASRSSSGNKPLPPFSYVNPHEVDLGYASSLGFSFPSLMGGNGGGYFLRDFVIPSSNSVIPGYGASSDFCPMTSLDGIPSMASSLIASTIFQEQHKFMSTGGLGYKEARGIRNNSKPLYPFENLQVKFDEGHPGDDVVKWSVPCQTPVHEIDSSNLTRSLCWNTIANGAIGSWHPEAGSNVGSSVPSLI